ncbi:CBS domain-containing protein [Bacillus atrophaeus]|uniref:CBS domain-containing protein n=1 Tax=Bacillus atrophaeus TaxID=1452 RepID=UPI001EFAB2D0|nr:CBS domain-containing protein [Bacillus atrophaeus]MCG8395366.1 CBS domain-containing protein [Bacillus atrophaeus]
MTKIKELMTADLQYCTVLDNVYEAAVKMKDADVGAVPVVDEDGETLVGIVTDRDLVLRGIASKRPNSQKITDAMTKEPVSVDEDTAVDEVLHLMAARQLRRIPVTKNKKLVGIVTLGDLALSEQTNERAGSALSDISEDDENGRQGFVH